MGTLGSNSISSEGYGNGAITLDEKKKRRKLSYRESVRRSRLKRQQYVKDLNDQVVHFSAENGEIDFKCKDTKRDTLAWRIGEGEGEEAGVGAEKEAANAGGNSGYPSAAMIRFFRSC